MLMQNPAGSSHQLNNENTSAKDAIHSSANRSVRPYSSNQEYLYAMREDLADWLKGLYAIAIDVENFFEILKTGAILCEHANNITKCACYTQKSNKWSQWKNPPKIPSTFLNFHKIKHEGLSSFFARDNIANFITWCRKELAIHESLMFETDDLVQRKNEKNFILCLLEVARRGSKFGVPAPVLIQMEEEIDEEIELEKVSKQENLPPKKTVKQKVTCDFKSLDEMVQYILGMCTCPSQFPMVRVSDGKYKVGGSENLIFMRESDGGTTVKILRQHVMVRVGGGWDTLEQYLNKHDPCRCQQHKNDRKTTSRNTRNARTNNNTTNAERSSVTAGFQSGGNRGRTRPTVEKSPRGTNTPNQLSPTRRPEKRVGYYSKHESPYQARETPHQAREMSKTPTLDSRKSRYRVSSTSPEKQESRKSTYQRESKPNMYHRLSRPKSTPPVSRNTTVFQNDTDVVVQRSKKGTHEIQRTSTQQSPENRHSVADRSRSRPSDINNNTRNKPSSSYSSQPSVRPSASSNRNSKYQKTLSNDHENYRTPRSSSPRKQTSHVQPRHEEIDAAREKEMLQAFERECIANQYTLKMRKNKSRSASLDNLLETQSNADDNEVAFHMNSSPGDVESTALNSYQSLPRPRKDKASQHDRRTKIPTPVSFNNRTLLTSRSIDLNDSERIDDQSASSLHERWDSNEHKSTGVASDVEKAGPHDPPHNFSVNDLNRLLDPCSISVENETNKYSNPLDSSLLHSSAHPESLNDSYLSQATFYPIQKSLNEVPDPSFDPSLPPSHSHHTAPPSSYKERFGSSPLNEGLGRENYSYAHDLSSSSRVPAHILKTCNLTSTPRFKPEFLHNPPNHVDTYAREPQWV